MNSEIKKILDNIEEEIRQVKGLLLRDSLDEKPIHEAKTWSYIVPNHGYDWAQCTCGEITRYKVPLRSITDFICPKGK
jgi:hypothetical protein